MFLGLIILALIAYLLWPVVKAMLAVREVQRNVRDAFGRAAAGASAQSATGRPKRSRKKIDKDVGEYVEYEEIIVNHQESASHSSGGTRVTEVESQIVDAEWEELPPRKE